MQQYKDFLQEILDEGEERNDRTGTGTISKFSTQMKFNLKNGFPLTSIKKTSLRIIFEELMWFLRGQTNAALLAQKDVKIWNKDAYRHYCNLNPQTMLSYEAFCEILRQGGEEAERLGELGPIYGKQWRAFGPEMIDQIKNVIETLKHDPHSRRHIVVAYNVADIKSMSLPPCHYAFQFYSNSQGLSLKVALRSNDGFLGTPFNIASYALLIHMVALEIGSDVHELVLDVCDAHIYKNHIEQVKTILTREPLPLPQIKLNKKEHIWDYEWEDIKLINYQYHPSVKGEMST